MVPSSPRSRPLASQSAQNSLHKSGQTHTPQNGLSFNNGLHIFFFFIEKKCAGDRLKGNNGEKGTNLKGIDFLILINTFPLLQGPFAGHSGHIFLPLVDKRHLSIAINFKEKK